MKKYILVILMVLIFINGMGSAQEYILRPGDELNIIVSGYTELGNSQNNNLPYIIRPDGKVSFPLVGEVDITGLTVTQFTKVLKKKLSYYIIDPNVTVNIQKFGGVRVYVLGEINKPGVYELTKSHTLIDAIGAARGFTRDTAKKKVILIRRDHPKKFISINLNYMLKTGDLKQDYEMHEGDIIYMTRNGRIDFSRDIMPILSGAYMVSEIKNNND